MSYRYFFVFLKILLLCYIPIINAKEYLIPLDDVTLQSAKGSITITNNTNADIPGRYFILGFTLNQQDIESFWGEPWLDWKKIKLENNVYYIKNQVPIPNGIFKPNQSISIKYSPVPWESTEVAHSMVLFKEQKALYPAKFTSDISEKWGNVTIQFTNTSDQSISLIDSKVVFNYTHPISSIWGTPWAAWSSSVEDTKTILTASEQINIRPNESFNIVFNGNKDQISDINLFVPVEGDPVPTDPTSSIKVTTSESPLPELNANLNLNVFGDNEFARSKEVAFNSEVVFDELPIKYTYKFQSNILYDLDQQKHYKPIFMPASVVLTESETANVAMSYEELASGYLSFNLQGLIDKDIILKLKHQETQNTFDFNINNSSRASILPGNYEISATQIPGYNINISPTTLQVLSQQESTIFVDVSPVISSGKKYVGYFESWYSTLTNWAGTIEEQAATSDLANLPSFVNIVNIAFMKPDATYSGNLDLTGTGLSFNHSGQIVKKAIEILKRKNPNTKVIISVGGATYKNWQQLNINAIANLVKDFNLDGVDIDWEPANADCSLANGKMSCDTDQELISIIDGFRQALPREQNYLITMAVWSVGAYGEPPYDNMKPAGSQFEGTLINPLRQAGDKVDMVHIMSYDASSEFDPFAALDAYMSIYSGGVTAGVQVPPEAWPAPSSSLAHVWTVDKSIEMAKKVIQNNALGMMIWSLHKNPGNQSPDYPSNNMLSQAICETLNIGDCNQTLINH